MAITFYARNIAGSVNTYKLASTVRGSSSQNLAITTTASGSNISGGFFVTPALRSFTLSGTVTVRVRARESSTAVNSGIRVRVYKLSKNGTLSGVLATLTAASELTNTDAAVNLTGTPTSTAFAEGDRVVFEILATNVGGTMASGTVTVTYNGPSGAAGDTYFTLTETPILYRGPRGCL